MTLIVNRSTTLQNIDGFGAAVAYSTTYSDEVANYLWGPNPQTGLGLSISRSMLWVDTSVGIQGWTLYYAPPWSGGTSLAGDFSVEKQSYDRGVRTFLLTVWAPPNPNIGPWPWLVGGSATGALISTHYDDMVSGITSALSNAFAAGVPFTHVSPANEPDFTPTGYAQTSWTTVQLIDFVKNHLGPGLATWGAANPSWQAATGLSKPKLVVGETSNWANQATWIAAFEADSTALSFVDIYATHQYFGNAAASPPNPCSRLIWMTEVSGQGAADASISDALTQIGWLYNALTTGVATAWLYWFARDVSDNNNGWLTGTPATNWSNQPLSIADWNSLATPPKRAYALGNFAKFVLPNSKLITTSGSPSGVNTLAFNRIDGRLVIVCINTNVTSTSLSVSINKITGTNVTPWITDSSNNLIAQSAISISGGTFSTTLTANSVTTFIESITGAVLSTISINYI